MVKKRYTSKRTTLKDKYKIQKRTKETHRKRKKEAKRDAAKGIVHHPDRSKKDPGIPNSWPFKEELLNDIKRSKESLQQRQRVLKEKRLNEKKLLQEQQEQLDGTTGTPRTVEDLMLQAQRSQDAYNSNSNSRGVDSETKGG
jgi:GNL3L/Grn1 putative GTPase